MLIGAGVEVECHINPANPELVSYHLSLRWARTCITYGSIISVPCTLRSAQSRYLREGNRLCVRGLDAPDGTPVFDIKLYLAGIDCFKE
jgi:hypothetical protein